MTTKTRYKERNPAADRLDEQAKALALLTELWSKESTARL
jgi:hypothetical protein